MSQPFNIREVISQSTSDVALSELAKKGFKKVKVLHKDAVNNLVQEAVNRVIEARLSELGEQDRTRIVEEARGEFNRLAREHQKQETVADGYRLRIAELEAEMIELRQQLQARYEEIATLQVEQRQAGDISAAVKAALLEARGAGSGELGELKSVLELLAQRLASGGSMGGGGSGGLGRGTSPENVSDQALARLFSNFGDVQVESNLDKVQARHAKSGGVSNSLNKLKSLQKGEGQ